MGWFDELMNGGIERKCTFLAHNAAPLDVAGAALMCTVKTIEEIGRSRDLFTSADTKRVADYLEIAKVQTEAIADLQRVQDKLDRVTEALEMIKDGED